MRPRTSLSNVNNRDLYITYKDVVDSKCRFLFNELATCFSEDGGTSIEGTNLTDDTCQFKLMRGRTSTKYLIFEKGNNIWLSNIQSDCVEKKAFLKTRLNPYKKLDNSCLQ